MKISSASRVAAGLAALAVMAAGCGGGTDNASGSAQGGESLTYAHCEPENPLVPVNTNESCGSAVVDALFTGLYEYDPDTAEPVAEMLDSIETDDNTTWTIKIKEGWQFHDGTEVTAASFVDAWNWGAYGPNAALNAYFFDPIQGYADVQPEDPDGSGPQAPPTPKLDKMSGLRVVDDVTFEVTLTGPQSLFPMRLGYNAFMPMPQVFFDDPEAFGANPVGNGPFRFASWDHKQSIKVDRWSDYQGPHQPTVSAVDFKIYQSLDSAYADLLADNVDVMEELPSSALAGDQYKQDLGDRQIVKATGRIQTVTFPMYDKRFQNPDLRKAISLAIDRELIVKTVFNNVYQVADGWVSPAVAGYEPGACADLCDYDPARARELLQRAGGFTGQLMISYNADGAHKEWVEAVCNSIKNTLSIDCLAKPYVDFATFRQTINARKMQGQLIRTGWVMDYPSIENFLIFLYATGGSANDGLYSSPEFDSIVTQAAEASSQDEAVSLYRDSQRPLVQDMPVIPLWYPANVAGYSTKVQDVKVTPFGTIDLISIKK